jgi:hypothetical protein
MQFSYFLDLKFKLEKHIFLVRWKLIKGIADVTHIARGKQDLRKASCKEISLLLSLFFLPNVSMVFAATLWESACAKTISIKSSRRRLKRQRDDKTETTTLKTALWMCYFERAQPFRREALLHQPREKNANGIISPELLLWKSSAFLRTLTKLFTKNVSPVLFYANTRIRQNATR